MVPNLAVDVDTPYSRTLANNGLINSVILNAFDKSLTLYCVIFGMFLVLIIRVMAVSYLLMRQIEQHGRQLQGVRRAICNRTLASGDSRA